MDLSHADYEVDLGDYKTPLSKLAKRFKASLELWKAKYQELRSELKRYQNRANDARRSRDKWKQEAQQWRACAEQLQAELDLVHQETTGPKSKHATTRQH